MTALILLILVGPAIVTVAFTIQMAAGLRRQKVANDRLCGAVRTVVVMPANNEAFIIGATLTRLLPELEGWAKLLIVADNCSDETAAIGRSFGVEVIERASALERGKGYALAFAQDYLRADPPAAVIIFDADCVSDRASLLRLSKQAVDSGRPSQAIYLMRPDPTAPPLVQVSSFAFMIKNLIRQRGLQRLADQVHLTGTGMAFEWALFEAAPLASGNIIEDVELGRELARRGHPPMLVEDATVWSAPASVAGTLIQRRRWEGGFLALARQQAPNALYGALRDRNWRTLVVAIDLLIPPLSLLAMIDLVALLSAGALTLAMNAPLWPLILTGCICMAAVAQIVRAWRKEGQDLISGQTLMRLPIYVLWKIPLYLNLMRARPSGWVRPGRPQNDR